MAEPATETPCATCGQPVVPAFRPFCSKRCANIDLHRWLSGRYAIPADEDDPGLDGDETDAGQAGRA